MGGKTKMVGARGEEGKERQRIAGELVSLRKGNWAGQVIR